MCYLLQLGIPKDRETIIDSLSTGDIIAYREETCLASHLAQDFIAFSLITNGCSCDLYTGARGSTRDLEKDREKYRKKGWSEAKIDRALNQSQCSDASFRADAKALVDSLVKQLDKLYVLVHWTDDDVKEGVRNLTKNTFLELHVPVNENEIVLVS